MLSRMSTRKPWCYGLDTRLHALKIFLLNQRVPVNGDRGITRIRGRGRQRGRYE